MPTYTDSERLEFFFRGNIEVAASRAKENHPADYAIMELVGPEDYIYLSHGHANPRDAVDEAITRKDEGLGEVDDPYRVMDHQASE